MAGAPERHLGRRVPRLTSAPRRRPSATRGCKRARRLRPPEGRSASACRGPSSPARAHTSSCRRPDDRNPPVSPRTAPAAGGAVRPARGACCADAPSGGRAPTAPPASAGRITHPPSRPSPALLALAHACGCCRGSVGTEPLLKLGESRASERVILAFGEGRKRFVESDTKTPVFQRQEG